MADQHQRDPRGSSGRLMATDGLKGEGWGKKKEEVGEKRVALMHRRTCAVGHKAAKHNNQQMSTPHISLFMKKSRLRIAIATFHCVLNIQSGLTTCCLLVIEAGTSDDTSTPSVSKRIA